MTTIQMSAEEKINEPEIYKAFLLEEENQANNREYQYSIDNFREVDSHTELRNPKYFIPISHFAYTPTGLEVRYMGSKQEVYDLHRWNDHFLMLVDEKSTAMNIIISNCENLTIFQVSWQDRQMLKLNLKNLISNESSPLHYLLSRNENIFKKIVKVIQHDNDIIDDELLKMSGWIKK